MLRFAENDLIQNIGPFGTVGAVINNTVQGGVYRSRIDIDSSQSASDFMPGQCQAFLTSSREFVWFVEEWDVTPKAENQTSVEVPLVTLENKKVYPAKVTGLNLALLGLSDSPTSVTVRWREGLIRYGSYYDDSYSDSITPCLRPGFGEVIFNDLKRPLLSETVTTNHLGLTHARANSPPFSGPLGRLMSMAFWVDPIEAEKYDKSKNKKKKKSLNEQDYQQMPEYPPYTPYEYNSGY